ncbi:MAG TPA: hypothetical protein ENH59_08925 [Bacteroidetes bacterium]|nr:hypothetical protein [Bacteroidota bacterium]
MVRIIAIRVIDRIKESGHTQKVLSKHSAIIKSRLGFHELNEDKCSREAYILLHLKNDELGEKNLMEDLDKIYGIEIKRMNPGERTGQPGTIPAGSTVAVAGLIIKNRSEIISEVQKVLTSFGCTIRTRLGINQELNGEEMGLILLELIGDNSEMNKLIQRLNDLGDVSVRTITFG